MTDSWNWFFNRNLKLRILVYVVARCFLQQHWSFYEVLWKYALPEHVLGKIHYCTFRPKDFLHHIFDPNSFHFISHTAIFLLCSTFHPLTLCSSLQKDLFITAHFRSSLHIKTCPVFYLLQLEWKTSHSTAAHFLPTIHLSPSRPILTLSMRKSGT